MPEEKPAGGAASIIASARAALRAGLGRALPALARVNQADGFDCPGCAWPEPEGRSHLEFCENGAKAVAHAATGRCVGAAFFARWPVSKLLTRPGRWLEAQGRLAEPIWRPAGSDLFQPIGWDDAFSRAGAVLAGLASPDEAVFYTSGRTSNEAAFLYQLFARELGTNNLPDCSNLCHESSGTGLSEMIGTGKGTVSLDDFERADLILVLGQNPGSNHPRMLTTLEAAARRDCRIVSINPLRERGLVRFAHPKDPLGMLRGGTPLAERFVRVKAGGDVALLEGVMHELFRLEDERPGEVLDRTFLEKHTEGLDALRAAVRARDPADLERGAGVSRGEMRELAELYAGAERVIACWAMGLTQHRHGVHNVQQVMNLLLLRGNIGRPGTGPCPVRGHSNVQGDRTMGIWERPSEAFLDRLGAEFGFAPPRRHGLSSVEAIEALHARRASVFVAMGGNFAAASPDTALTEQALGRCRLGVHVATTLNRTHLVTGREALLLPCLSRAERDLQAAGEQFVTVEDSMAAVHASRGRLAPASPSLRSEVAIVAGLARATLGARSRVPWQELAGDYARIRERIGRVIPGFEDFELRVQRGGFVLPRAAAERRFETPSGKARLIPVPLPELDLPPGWLRMLTVRSHDQYNTTVYGDDDRYRGVTGDRRVVLMHVEDMRERGLADGGLVDLVSGFEGEERELRGFRARGYDVPRGCAVTYFPEANPLVPLRQYAERSLTPAYKSVAIRVVPRSPA